MKILLIGEYSRLHNSLKEGLTALGHDVVLIGKKDSFKNYPVDVSLENKIFGSKAMQKVASAFEKLFKINLIALENYWIFYRNRKCFTGFDVVQFINESILKTYSNLEIKALKYIAQNNKKNFLLCCGIDYISVKYAYEQKYRYSILTPYFEDSKNKKEFTHILRVLDQDRWNVRQAFLKYSNGCISSDLDYHLPYQNTPNYLGMIANPINTNKIHSEPIDINNKIVIFHGINTETFVRKGNRYFKEALEIISEKYGEKVEIIETYNIPYHQYINHYNNAHIFLDQVYAYDQGYNALEAMGKGKVVFTGAEKEWLDYYQLKENTVAINALPDVNDLVNQMSDLIEHPEKIIQISQNAKAFIHEQHHYVTQAQNYLDVWTNN